jgi:hypothetical protein
VGVGRSTVYRTKQRFVLGNLEAALSEEPRPGASRKLSGKEKAPPTTRPNNSSSSHRKTAKTPAISYKLTSLNTHLSVHFLAHSDLSSFGQWRFLARREFDFER